MQIRNDSSSSLVSRARRGVLKAACGLAMASGLAFSSLAHAAYPDKTIQVIISFPPAGSTDVLARAVTQRMSQVLGQSIVVENRAGAGGAIGLTAGARAQPDGYGLYLAATTNQAIAANIYKNQAAHLIKDFEPIGLIGFVPHVLVVPAQLPVKSVSELLAYIRAKPGHYNYASQGVGTLSHLESELFVARNKLDITHVPYKGSSQALPSLVSGDSVMMFDSVTGSMPLVKGNRLRILAVASSERIGLLPDVPTLAQAGVENVVADNAFGLFAPKGTPADVIQTLANALKTALEDPALKATMAEQGVELKFGPGSELAQIIEKEHEEWGAVVRAANVSAQ
jgi:tripartite-type tricarboxylate transporter receptor subunit TctC